MKVLRAVRRFFLGGSLCLLSALAFLILGIWILVMELKIVSKQHGWFYPFICLFQAWELSLFALLAIFSFPLRDRLVEYWDGDDDSLPTISVFR